jgi:hypothetical protein
MWWRGDSHCSELVSMFVSNISCYFLYLIDFVFVYCRQLSCDANAIISQIRQYKVLN